MADGYLFLIRGPKALLEQSRVACSPPFWSGARTKWRRLATRDWAHSKMFANARFLVLTVCPLAPPRLLLLLHLWLWVNAAVVADGQTTPLK